MTTTVLVIIDKFERLCINHFKAIEKASQYGGKVIVAVPSEDTSPKKTIDLNRIQSNEERLFLLKSITGVDEVCFYEDLINLQTSINYDVLIQDGTIKTKE